MNRKNIIIMVSVTAVIIVGIISYSYLMKPPMEVSEESEQSGGENIVLIENFAYSPQELTISAGETVVWTNKDSVRHNVVSENGSELSSDLLRQNQTYSHTFNQTGEYSYYCAPHPYMKGKIIVK